MSMSMAITEDRNTVEVEGAPESESGLHGSGSGSGLGSGGLRDPGPVPCQQTPPGGSEEPNVGVEPIDSPVLSGQACISLEASIISAEEVEDDKLYAEIKGLELCFEQTGDIDNISQVICLYKKLVSKYSYSANVHSSAYATLKDLFSDLGRAYTRRFQHTRDIDDVEQAIFHLRNAVESTPASNPSVLFLRCNNLANAFTFCFERTGNVADIEQAILYYQKAVKSADLQSSTFYIQCCNNLGNAYRQHFTHTGDITDIQQAISLLNDTIKSTPSDHSLFPSLCGNLGNAYVSCFTRTGNLQDIGHAISYLQDAVNFTPAGHSDLFSYFNNLGSAYRRLFEHTGNLEDIDQAILYLERAVESISTGHAFYSVRCTSLGNAYIRRFEHTGDSEDIEHAILYLRRAVDSTPSGHSSLSSRCNSLGNAYISRFESTGDLQDIEHGISHLQNAIKAMPSGRTTLSNYHNSLGSAYGLRFEHTSDIQDIEHAILYLQKSVDLTPLGHSMLSSRCDNLANAYNSRFKRTGDIQDIEHAILHLEKAVEYIPPGHSTLCLRLNHLGNAYISQFEHTGDVKDIERAISYFQDAIDSLPLGHSRLALFQSNIGSAYRLQFEHTGNKQDIERAISYLKNAVESTPSGHLMFPSRCNGLGNAYMTRYNHLNDHSDADLGILSYADGATTDGPRADCLQCADSAAMAALKHKTSDEDTRCLDYFSLAVGLLTEVAGLEQTIHRRYSNLDHHSDLVTRAVAAAVAFGRPDLVLEWLEQGRCLVWNQLGQLRTPIDELAIQNQVLANKFIEVATALESDGSRSLNSLPISLDEIEEQIHEQDMTVSHTVHAAEYKRLLDEIRSSEDFHDFLRPLGSDTILSSIPNDGFVVILNSFGTGCHAMALKSGALNPMHIPLNDFSPMDADNLRNMLQSDILHYRDVEDGERLTGRRRNRKSISDILKQLWSKVVHPILVALDISVPPLPSNRPRIWWCPTGSFSFLPVHAAGMYGADCKPGSCVSDFVISSYTPTVRSLSEKFAASAIPSRQTNLLLISQPHTPGLSPIPSTSTETHAMRDMLKEDQHINTLLLENSEATVEEVKRRMGEHGWVHFACHGIQDRSDPLQSGVHLHDGRLELLEIIRQKLPTPELAFLSACQTSKGDFKLSDEVVHLAAGMLASGFRGVVGTMWSISDKYGPDFAESFYRYLLHKRGPGGLDSTLAAHALDHATREAREKLGDDESSLLTWVPYVHFGY